MKKRSSVGLLALSALLLLQACGAPQASPTPVAKRPVFYENADKLLPFRDENDLWGYIDRQGNVVIPPTLKSQYGFSNGFLLESYQVCYDAQGNVVLRAEGDGGIEPLEGGGFLVSQPGRYDVFDANYEMVSSITVENEVYINNLGPGFLLKSQWVPYSYGGMTTQLTVLDLQGNVVLSPRIEAVVFFGKHFILTNSAENNNESRWQIVDLETKNVVDIPEHYSFSFGGDFGDLRTRISDDDLIPFYDARVGAGACGAGYMNGRGEVVIPPRYWHAAAFSEGKAAVWDANNKIVFIDTQGRELFGGKSFVDVREFSDGMAAVVLEENENDMQEFFGYINEHGELVISPRFLTKDLNAECQPTGSEYGSRAKFYDGVAVVGSRVGGGFMYIDKTGKEFFRYSLPGVPPYPRR